MEQPIDIDNVVNIRRSATLGSENVKREFNHMHRPQFHFTPPKNWMNDPNGLVYIDGWYHLYYQHNPNANDWGDIHWGHAVSRDLLHWKHLPPAIKPHDELGIVASGSAVVDYNNTSGLAPNGSFPLVAMFSHFAPDDTQMQSIAFSTDRGMRWNDYKGNPVIPNNGLKDFRDPKVIWFEPDSCWVMVLAAGDHILFYRSPNLIDWQQCSEFGKELGDHGEEWECPDLLLMRDADGNSKWVLMVSVQRGAPNGGSATQYFIGEFDGHQFVASEKGTPHWMDFGPDNYASVSWSNLGEDSSPIIIGWMSNWKYADRVPTDSWRGAMTVPREVYIEKRRMGYRLLNRPVNNLKLLRRRELAMHCQSKVSRCDFPEQCIEVVAVLKSSTLGAGSFQFVFSNPEEQLVLRFDAAAKELTLDRHGAMGSRFVEARETVVAKVEELPEVIELQILLDRSSIEVFFDGGVHCLTALVFPDEPFSSVKLTLDDTYTKEKLHVYPLESVWLDGGSE